MATAHSARPRSEKVDSGGLGSEFSSFSSDAFEILLCCSCGLSVVFGLGLGFFENKGKLGSTKTGSSCSIDGGFSKWWKQNNKIQKNTIEAFSSLLTHNLALSFNTVVE